MGGSSKGAPAAPDFNAAVERQGASSADVTGRQTQSNRPDQTNAFGGTTSWTKTPGAFDEAGYGAARDQAWNSMVDSQLSGKPDAAKDLIRQTLDSKKGDWTSQWDAQNKSRFNGPDTWAQQQHLGGPLGDAATGLEHQIAGQGPLDNGTATRDKTIDATYAQEKSRLDPQWNQGEESMRSTLANQGLDPGSQAYDAARGNFDRAKTDSYDTAMRNAISTGNEAQALTFGENVASQNQPYQQLGQLRGFTEMPNFMGAGASQAMQYLPGAMAQYAGALQGYSDDQAKKNSAMSGLGSLAGGAAGWGLGGPAGGMVGSNIGSKL